MYGIKCQLRNGIAKAFWEKNNSCMIPFCVSHSLVVCKSFPLYHTLRSRGLALNKCDRELDQCLTCELGFVKQYGLTVSAAHCRVYRINITRT